MGYGFLDMWKRYSIIAIAIVFVMLRIPPAHEGSMVHGPWSDDDDDAIMYIHIQISLSLYILYIYIFVYILEPWMISIDEIHGCTCVDTIVSILYRYCIDYANMFF